MALVGVGATSTQVGVRHNLDIKDVGFTTTVNDDCRSRLMYYLKSFSGISKFCQVHPEWEKYTHYQNYNSLTIAEEEELYHICKDVITIPVCQAVGFIEVPDSLLPDSNNTFFEITNTDEILLSQVHVHISENSLYAANRVIGEKREIKMEVMMHRREWIDKNYYTPLRNLSDMIYRHKREKREAEERRLREIKEAEERKRREIREAEERKKREEERRIERERRIAHNKEVLNKNRFCCCIITKKDDSEHPNLVKFILVLYFIHTLALMFLFLNSKKQYDELPWLKWVQLAGFVIGLINVFLAIVCVMFVFISCCYKNWIIYVKIFVKFMMCISILSIPISYFMYSYFVVTVIQMLMSLSMSCFGCVIYKETKIHSNMLCLCCGAKKVSHDKLFYDL